MLDSAVDKGLDNPPQHDCGGQTMSALEILQSIQKSAEWLIYSLLLRNPAILFHKWNFDVILTRVTHWA